MVMVSMDSSISTAPPQEQECRLRGAGYAVLRYGQRRRWRLVIVSCQPYGTKIVSKRRLGLSRPDIMRLIIRRIEYYQNTGWPR